MSVLNPSPLVLTESIECIDLDDADLDALRDDAFSIIRAIRDPEHAYTLEQLGIVDKQAITFPAYMKSDKSEPHMVSLPADQSIDNCEMNISIKPTVPHCSLATLIGLCIRTRVKRDWPSVKLSLSIAPNSHLQADEISKQLNDKERCLAALENPALADTVESLIKHQEGMYD